MTAKEFLQRGWKLNKEIEALNEAKQEAFDRATAAGYVMKDVVTSGSNPINDNRFSNYVSYSEQIDKRINKLMLINCEILEAIGTVEDSKLRTLLTYRYLKYMTWEEIAEKINYSWRHINTMHGKALSLVKFEEC